MKKKILLTFDVEDWFQVENFKEYINFSTWNYFELRVKKSTEKILNILESLPSTPKATFFILGWIAKRLPDLVMQIHERGHEIASHGLNHRLCTSLNQHELIKDLTQSRLLLEDITGAQVYGYRAPSFAINDSMLYSIKQAGYSYDSSFNSFSGHGRYGKIDVSAAEKMGSCFQVDHGFFELPVSNIQLKDKIVPLGGGGYFRLYPFCFFRLGMKFVLKKEEAFIFYAHPWEFDPGQPRVRQASPGFKFRHYINLHRTENKLKHLIESFPDCKFMTCGEYISRVQSRG